VSTLKTDAVTAVSTNTSITVKGLGSGVVKLGDGELKFPDADSTAGYFIKTDGSAQLSFAAAGGFTLGTEVVTTSGTAAAFTSIPAGTKLIVISLNGFSFASTDGQLEVTIGDSGGLETSGYSSVATSSDQVTAELETSDAFNCAASNSQQVASLHSGQITLTLEDSSAFTWVMISSIAAVGSNDTFSWGAGAKTLTAELTQLSVSMHNGTTFDAGSINIMYQ
jgi:hypothetical protein